jgi:hypothetical protein
MMSGAIEALRPIAGALDLKRAAQHAVGPLGGNFATAQRALAQSPSRDSS